MFGNTAVYFQKRRSKWYTPIQTSPNCPLPRRLMSCSDSRGISHTSLVLTDRSVRRGIPLWHGTISLQHSPAALAGETFMEFRFKASIKRYKRMVHDEPHQSSAGQAAVTSQTGPGSWYSNHRCPAYGFYSAWRGLLWCHPSLGSRESRPLVQIQQERH